VSCVLGIWIVFPIYTLPAKKPPVKGALKI
jgi:hypothetical protein